LHRETPGKARARVAQLREALADAKAEVLDYIRELQSAQRDVEKAEYDREAKVGTWQGCDSVLHFTDAINCH
jgi:multidrug resistance efflux pump